MADIGTFESATSSLKSEFYEFGLLASYDVSGFPHVTANYRFSSEVLALMLGRTREFDAEPQINQSSTNQHLWGKPKEKGIARPGRVDNHQYLGVSAAEMTRRGR